MLSDPLAGRAGVGRAVPGVQGNPRSWIANPGPGIFCSHFDRSRKGLAEREFWKRLGESEVMVRSCVRRVLAGARVCFGELG